KTETPKPGNTALDSSALSPLQLLTTMVSSVHIVRTEDSDEKHKIVSTANPRRNHNQQEQRHSLTRDRDRRGPNTTNERDRNDKRGNNRTSRQEKTHGGKKVLPVPDTCTQCLKKKQAEDLRLDKEDNNYYCYSCWAKLGWEFCRECGEFNKGYRERTRRRIGEFYCNNCWSNFNKGEEEEEGGEEAKNKDDQANMSRNEPRKQKQQKQPGRNSANSAATEDTIEKTTKKGATDRKGTRNVQRDGVKPNTASAGEEEEEEEAENMNANSLNNVEHLDAEHVSQAKKKKKKRVKKRPREQGTCVK
ncbi:hypothetical protein MOQ_002150, partial [Trypanosoma cruzi marinkellei]